MSILLPKLGLREWGSSGVVQSTVDRESFVVKIFPYLVCYTKI